jgi:hypothetical protein
MEEGWMILNVYLDDNLHPIEVPDDILDEAEEFFRKMDQDMDKGWQMGREWVENPDETNRCQIVADRLLTALEAGDKPMLLLMAGYILSRFPHVTRLDIDTSGEMQNTQIITTSG